MNRQHDEHLSRYIDRVRALPLLDREVEHAFALRARDGDREAIDRLVEANLRHAVNVALQYRRYGHRVADLVAEGNVGLMIAARKFDPDRGTRFVTYAGYWIRAFVLDYVVKNASLVGAGSGALRSKVFFRLRRERARISNLVLDENERLETLAAKFSVTPEKMSSMLVRLDGGDISLDQHAGPETTVSLVDTLPANTTGQDAAFLSEERRHALEAKLGRALGTLDRRERYIVEQRLMGDDEMSLAAIGRELGVSRERARQLEARAKEKLRRELEEFADVA